MKVFRISKKKHAATAMTGKGAAIAPGRWNYESEPVVYCSESRALATLEILVNLGSLSILPEYVLFECELPDDLPTLDMSDYIITDSNLSSTKSVGSLWLKECKAAVMAVSSAVVQDEINYLLNPAHPDFKKITISDPVPFELDRRLLGQLPQ